MAFIGKLMGAVDALRLITKGPGPPRRGEAGSGSSKSSIVKCQISLVNGVLIGVPIKRSTHPEADVEDIGELRRRIP
jgi:hypothetical protein